MKHRFRKTFEEELLICFAYEKINLINYFKIIKFSNSYKFISNANRPSSLSENGLLVRKNNAFISSLSKEWTKITIVTIRDQLSLILALNYLKNLNFKRRFFNKNFSFSEISFVRDRIRNDPKFLNLLKKIVFSFRLTFIYLLNLLIKTLLFISKLLKINF